MPVQYSPFRSYATGYPDKHIIMDGEKFQIMLNFLSQSPIIVFDFETSGLRWYQESESCGLALGGIDGNGTPLYFYVPYRHQTGEEQLDFHRIQPAFKQLLENPNTLKIAHNIKFDEHMAHKDGYSVEGPRYDTLIAARLYDENRPLALKIRAEQDINRPEAHLWENELKKKVAELVSRSPYGLTEYKDKYGYAQVDIPSCGTYACFDIDFTYNLYHLYESWGLSSRYSRVWKNEMELTRIICEMEEFGSKIDVEYLSNLRETLAKEEQRLEDEVSHRLGGRTIRLSADADIIALMQSNLGLQWDDTTDKGKPAVNREVLLRYAEQHPVLGTIAQWKKANKLRTTYTDTILNALDSNNILHSEFNQIGTNTGRFSSSRPNFQNQPKDDKDRTEANGGIDPWSIKRAFLNRDTDWVRLIFDYSQIELRVLAFYSQDPKLTEAYLNNEDIHAKTAMEVFGDISYRGREAKIINFGLSYCLTDIGFSRQAKLPLEVAKQHMANFFQNYHGIASFQQAFWARVRNDNGYFENLWGRPRRVPNINEHKDFLRGRAERQAIATMIQGTAAELTKESMIRLYHAYKGEGLEAHICSTIHDEIQTDSSLEDAGKVCLIKKRLMEDYPEFSPIPIIVDGEYTRTNWAEKKGIEGM